MKRPTLVGTAVAVLYSLSVLPLLAQEVGPGRQSHNPPAVMGGINPRLDYAMRKTPMTPAQLLSQNPKLVKTLQGLLPADQQVLKAASGFTGLKLFVAAVHVAYNLHIPFDQLKEKVIEGNGLGEAVRTLNPKLTNEQVKSEVKRAKRQAKTDIKTSHFLNIRTKSP